MIEHSTSLSDDSTGMPVPTSSTGAMTRAGNDGTNTFLIKVLSIFMTGEVDKVGIDAHGHAQRWGPGPK